MEERRISFEFTWKLENHNVLAPSFLASVESPEFEVPSIPRIKWHLGYYTKSTYESLSVFLKRSNKDDGPTTYDAKYNISILGEDSSNACNSEITTISFRKGYSRISTVELVRGKEVYTANILILKCTFFATEEQAGDKLQEDDTVLSSDIKNLFANEVLPDITLKQSNFEFKAHKSILWARCPELLTIENSTNVLEDSNTDNIQRNELKSLLQDLYSGTLDTFRSDTQIALPLRKFELFLQGRSIQSFCVCSNVQTYSASHVWSLDINQLRMKKLYSPVLAVKDNEFKLVAQILHSEREKLEFSLRCVRTKTSKPVYLRCKMKFLERKGDFSIASSHFFNSGDDYFLPWELYVDVFRYYEKCDYDMLKSGNSSNFNFECMLSVSDGSILHTSETWYSKPLSTQINYSVLSDDLFKLHKSKKFSDVSLLTGENTFPAHKAILAARSPVFSRMFRANMTECLCNEVKITDVESKNVEYLLEYIYSGKVMVQNFASVMQLYTAADKYEVLNLKQNCASYLENKMDTENVCKILILADMHQDVKLKKSCQTFIYKNAAKILVTDEWKYFIESRSDLAVEILYQLSLKYAR